MDTQETTSNDGLCASSSGTSIDHTNNVEVICRLKPCDCQDDERCIKVISSTSLKVITPLFKITNGIRQEVSCEFKKIIMPESTQEEVFDSVANDMVTGLIRGKNGLLFTYGITGSGKTFTLSGTSKDPGILPRCIMTLYNAVKNNLAPPDTIRLDKNGQVEFAVEGRTPFTNSRLRNTTIYESPACLKDCNNAIEVDKNIQYSLFISMHEIYNNNLFDLFDEQTDPISRLPVSKNIRENNYKGIFIPGLVYIPIRSVSEALTYYRKGKKHRKVAQTLLNTQSSRSHCVFTMYLVRIENIDNGSKSASLNQLSLCDLAGSERLYRTNNEGSRQKESSSINSSLMTLRTCIEALRENQKSKSVLRVIPYRESRLTLTFRNFFEGDGRVRMIICLNSIPGDFEENLHVIRFAEVTQEVKIKTNIKQRAREYKVYNEVMTCQNSLDVSSPHLSYDPVPFPPFPSSLLVSFDDSTTLIEIMSSLKESERLRNNLRQEMFKLAESISKEVRTLELENKNYRENNLNNRSKFEELERELAQLRQSYRIAKTKIANLEEAQKKHVAEISRLKSENDILTQKYSNEKSARHILKRKLKDIQDHQVDHLERECNKRVNEATEDIKNQLRRHDQRLKVVKGVLQSTTNLPPLNESSATNTPCGDYVDVPGRKRKSRSNSQQAKKYII